MIPGIGWGTVGVPIVMLHSYSFMCEMNFSRSMVSSPMNRVMTSVTPSFSFPALMTACSNVSPGINDPAGNPQTDGKIASSGGRCTASTCC